MRDHRFSTSTILPLPRARVFPFFADAANLEVITPPELQFEILTPSPIEMRAGALIRYRLRLMALRFGWLTRISHWNPPHEFIDEQLNGPYRTWVHHHRFSDAPGGTLIEDDVAYSLPFFPIGEIAAPIVALQVRRIFAYRTGAIRRALGIEE
jgi:ligand-binding SRPBCC domain-containing protein